MAVVLKRIAILTVVLAMGLLTILLALQLPGNDSGLSDGTQGLQGIQLLTHNKNDDKDNCPNDGNAGTGDDDKGPGGGCKSHPPQGSYGNPESPGNSCTHKGKGKPPHCP